MLGPGEKQNQGHKRLKRRQRGQEGRREEWKTDNASSITKNVNPGEGKSNKKSKKGTTQHGWEKKKGFREKKRSTQWGTLANFKGSGVGVRRKLGE